MTFLGAASVNAASRGFDSVERLFPYVEFGGNCKAESPIHPIAAQRASFSSFCRQMQPNNQATPGQRLGQPFRLQASRGDP